MLNQKLYTVADVAELTGLTDRTIRNYLKDGTLHGKKIGVQWRFTEDDINALFLETQAIEDRIRTPDELISLFMNQEKLQSNHSDSCFISDFPAGDETEITYKWLEDMQEKLKEEKGPDLAFSISEDGKTIRIALKGSTEKVETVWKKFKKRISSYEAEPGV